jgi:hypothetical protein
VRFFADRERELDPRDEAAELARLAREVAGAPAGPERHGAVGALLVRTGALAQGIADAEREDGDADRAGPGERAAMAATVGLARALWGSWRAGGRTRPPRPDALDRLARARLLPESVRIRQAEGFAQYAVYPETYAAAAEALAGARPTVIGVRSIGTVLAAMASAGAGAGVPVTIRPVGHPFRREVRLAPALAARLGRRAGPFAIADEGPGLSGSSFAAVAEALAALDGASDDAIHLLPSHAGPPGPEGDARTRARFARHPRHLVPFEALFLGDGPLALGRLAEDALGEAECPAEDLSAGAWRGRVFQDPAAWPPSGGWRERRKYLLRAGGARWLARFVGLGTPGERALERARALAGARLVPAPAALRHGFLFERFERAVPLPLAAVPRPRLLAAVRRHLAFVAARFPARAGEGAPPRALAEMLLANARAALGPGVDEDVLRLARAVPALEREARPVAVDGKLQRWEWLLLPSGELLKADALDHHADHALVGCQDALWDVAGAAVELGLGAGEAEALARAVREASPGAPPSALPFYRAAYAAFELGRWVLAAGDPGLDGAEATRRRAEAARLSDALRDALAIGGQGSSPRVAADRPG